MSGLGSRMVEIHKPNFALTTILINEMLHRLKRHLNEIEDREERISFIVFGSHVVLSCVFH